MRPRSISTTPYEAPREDREYSLIRLHGNVAEWTKAEFNLDTTKSRRLSMSANMTNDTIELPDNGGRRRWIKAGISVATLVAGTPFMAGDLEAAALSEAQRNALTPDKIIEMMKAGNERFRSGKMKEHDYLAQKRASASGQYPAAIVLSCIDSRAPAEIILDMGIGDTFNARIAGNIVNQDILGSMEFACAVAGAKVILVMGHTACGAIKGAIDNVQLGNLTGLLQKVQPAIEATQYSGQRTSKNEEFVDAVARSNVEQAISVIRKQSQILADLESKGQIKLAGSMYDIQNGKVTFL
jgi:carbonic anhydrase